jgi:hypothetical protein
MTAHPLGENPVEHVVFHLGVVHPPTPPTRVHCPHTGPRPSWVPPDKFHCTQDHYLQGRYGVTCDEWWALYERQKGRCAICWLPLKGRRVVVDHDHRSGTIDGLCHFACNRRLHQRLREYLADPPGRHLGLVVAPAKLRAIQEDDRAKRRREQARRVGREQAKTGPPSDETFAARVAAALEQTKEA